MAETATLFFDRKWIHAPLADGKRGGAFAHPCVPQVHPYVLVNYTGNLRDVSTVAHELGHGIHQVLAGRQGHYNSDTPLPLAETASVFAELLVFNSQLNLLDSEEERRAFICQKLESIFATVFRQTAMNRFEQLMHDNRADLRRLRRTGRLRRSHLARDLDRPGASLLGQLVLALLVPGELPQPPFVLQLSEGRLHRARSSRKVPHPPLEPVARSHRNSRSWSNPSKKTASFWIVSPGTPGRTFWRPVN